MPAETFRIRIETEPGVYGQLLVMSVTPCEDAGWIASAVVQALIDGAGVAGKLGAWFPGWLRRSGCADEVEVSFDWAGSGIQSRAEKVEALVFTVRVWPGR